MDAIHHFLCARNAECNCQNSKSHLLTAHFSVPDPHFVVQKRLNFFCNKNVYLLIKVVYFRVISFGLYTASPMIVPLFKVFCEVHSLKVSKYVRWLFETQWLSLNLLLPNTVLSSGKERNHMALNPEGRKVVGCQPFCFWDRNFHRQSRVNRCIVTVEKPIPWIQLFILFSLLLFLLQTP